MFQGCVPLLITRLQESKHSQQLLVSTPLFFKLTNNLYISSLQTLRIKFQLLQHLIDLFGIVFYGKVTITFLIAQLLRQSVELEQWDWRLGVELLAKFRCDDVGLQIWTFETEGESSMFYWGVFWEGLFKGVEHNGKYYSNNRKCYYSP